MLMLAGVLSAQEVRQDTIVPKWLVNDYFFEDVPEKMPNTVCVGYIMDSEGNRIRFERFEKGVDLSDWSKRHSIPLQYVRNGKELLEKYQTADGSWFNFKTKPMPIRVGDRLPRFREKDMEGRIWTNKNMAGKVMVLNVWSTSCGPCLREMPIISKWRQECPDAQFFSATYETAEVARPVVEKRGFTFHHWVEAKDISQWAANGLPLTLLVDKQGIVRRVETGTSMRQRVELLETLKELCKE